MAVITSSVVKITLVVAEIILKVAVITSGAKITFVSADIILKVDVITSSLAKITFVVAELEWL